MKRTREEFDSENKEDNKEDKLSFAEFNKIENPTHEDWKKLYNRYKSYKFWLDDCSRGTFYRNQGPPYIQVEIDEIDEKKAEYESMRSFIKKINGPDLPPVDFDALMPIENIKSYVLRQERDHLLKQFCSKCDNYTEKSNDGMCFREGNLPYFPRTFISDWTFHTKSLFYFFNDLN